MSGFTTAVGISFDWKDNLNRLEKIEATLRKLEGGTTKAEMAFKTLSQTVNKTSNSIARTLKKATFDADMLSRKIKRLNANLRKTRKVLGGVARAARSAFGTMTRMTGLSGLGALYMGQRAMKQAGAVDKQSTLMMQTVMPGVGTQQDEVKAMLEKRVAQSSSDTGISQADYFDALNQHFSAGGSMTVDWSNFEEGKKKALELEESIHRIALAAGSTDTPIGDMQDAVIKMAKNFDLDPILDLERILEILNIQLDQGIGWMSQYTGQTQKYAASARQAGVSMELTSAIFTGLTGTMSADMAGHKTNSFLQYMNKGVRAGKTTQFGISRASKALYGSLEGGVTIDDQNKNWQKVIKGDYAGVKLGTDAKIKRSELKELAKFANPGNIANIYYDKEGKRRSGDEAGLLLTSTVRDIKSSGLSDALKDMIFQAMFPDQESRQVMTLISDIGVGGANQSEVGQTIDKAYDDMMQYSEIVDENKKKLKDGLITMDEFTSSVRDASRTNKKIEGYMNSAAYKLQRVGVIMENIQTSVGSALNTGFIAAVDRAEGKTSGADFNASFEKMRTQLEAILPGLGDLADPMKDIAKYLSSSEGKKAIASFIKGVAKLGVMFAKFMNFFVHYPIGTIIGVSMVKSVLNGGLGYAIGKSITKSIAGTAIGQSIGNTLAPMFASAGPIGIALLGVAAAFAGIIAAVDYANGFTEKGLAAGDKLFGNGWDSGLTADTRIDAGDKLQMLLADVMQAKGMEKKGGWGGKLTSYYSQEQYDKTLADLQAGKDLASFRMFGQLEMESATNKADKEVWDNLNKLLEKNMMSLEKEGKLEVVFIMDDEVIGTQIAKTTSEKGSEQKASSAGNDFGSVTTTIR